MNGAESLVRTLLNGGVDTCFANPGTSEMHFVAALDRIPGIRCILGLQENVVTGMADGYFRIARKPAATLLHCGPGLANGLGNLHNARRARSGIVNIVGDQATYHRPLDAPLTADTDGIARSVSAWLRTSRHAQDVGQDAAHAIQAARTLPGQIATLILPSDASWDEGGVEAELPPIPGPAAIDPFAVEQSARALRADKPVLILLAGHGVLAPAQAYGWRVAQATGAQIMADYGTSHLLRGRGRIQLARVPYNTDTARQTLAPFKTIILVGAKPPVGFFAYPGKPSTQYAPDTQFIVLSRPDQDATAALAMLTEAVGAPPVDIPDPGPRPDAPTGRVSPEGLAQAVAALMPENAIVSDESISYGRVFYPHTYAAPPHDWLHMVGGAIGDGLPVATGAAIGANGQRRVISLQADGSAMYSLQSLWTQAREGLPCTTVIISNRKYSILIGEYANVGANPGRTAADLLDLGNPNLDWIKLANGMGVEAAIATDLDTLCNLMRGSFGRAGPFLIELVV
ncbi:acetolactate synthase large subunit [Mesorhizobium sp. M6A.T.Ce.TU.016.01.1.1]|uniref:acetolactate synthase large subunit n=1 Tax=Mesorhizobium sp. M6A.T.Ce.TU.016.01.1.1 TaxID=2496783 RepID=UPI000FCAFB09|nr:acetolactate synthase large subunit [Mesorhizobium sp. M6A.T.Ce.TU.016.01.1.1]RUU32414.1 acetolactate synthase large subunit [Mesorhizobium sp. M6A.T.Ce.TU.016.01.1.1]